MSYDYYSFPMIYKSEQKFLYYRFSKNLKEQNKIISYYLRLFLLIKHRR